MSYEFDNGEVNEMYRCERDEARSARAGLTEVERARGCSHDHRPDRKHGVLVCVECGDTEAP